MERKRSNKGIKKLMCMLLAVALTVTLIPGGFARPDSASAEEPKLITSVDIYDVDMQPEAGDDLYYKGDCDSEAPYDLASTQEMQDYNYGVGNGRDGFIWKSNGEIVKPDANYVEGQKYSFVAVVIAKPGYKFADTVECSINGDKSLVVGTQSFGDDIAVYSIDLEAKTYQKINSVKLLNFDKPVAGKKPDYNVNVPAGAPYRIENELESEWYPPEFLRNGIIWSEDDYYADPDDNFYPGSSYSFVTTLIANPGYKFADDVDCVINNDNTVMGDCYTSATKTEVCITVGKFRVAPLATKSLSVKLYGYDDIKASWSKVTGAKGYKVYYKKSTAKSYTYKGKTTGTTMKLANLAAGSKYYVNVIPYATPAEYFGAPTSKTIDGPSKVSSGIYTLKKLNTPKVNKYSSSKVKVTWNNIAGESGYQISRSTKKTETNVVSTYATTSGKYKVLKTTRNKTYYYKVRAYKTVDGKKIYGPWSSVKSYKLK